MNKDDEYMKRRTKEKIKQNIIKWWNVKDNGAKNYIGSPELEDPLYGCPVYSVRENSVTNEILKMDHMQDLDYRDPLSNSLEEPASEPNEKDSEAVRIANEIYERLQREADEDARQKEAEIEAAKKANETDATFNAATGSYSGLYGQTPMSDSEKDAFAAIMAQNNNVAASASALFDTKNS